MLDWKEQYYVFHHKKQISRGDTITFDTRKETTLQTAWRFTNVFTEFKEPVSPGSVVIHDFHTSDHTIGLAQLIKGVVKPLGAIPSFNGITIRLTPKPYVYVFICRHK